MHCIRIGWKPYSSYGNTQELATVSHEESLNSIVHEDGGPDWFLIQETQTGILEPDASFS